MNRTNATRLFTQDVETAIERERLTGEKQRVHVKPF